MVDRSPSKLLPRGVRFRELTTAPRGLLSRAEKAEGQAEALEKLVNIDELTNLLNRRGLMKKFEQHVDRMRSNREERRVGDDSELAVVFIDLDKFKRVNDMLGHGIGDKLLVDFAKSLKEHLRANDIVARYGGDEVVLVLPVSGEDDLRQILFDRKGSRGEDVSVIGRVRRGMPKLRVGYDLSVGYSMVDRGELNGLGGSEAFKLAAERADQMMYKEKNRKKAPLGKLRNLFSSVLG